MKPGNVVVDLGAAPGGWSQVAKEVVGEKGIVIGIDLQEIEPIEGVVFIRGDIRQNIMSNTLIKTIGDILREKGRSHIPHRDANVAISNMSPNLGGNIGVATSDIHPNVGGNVDVVISDISPNISGNYDVDEARSVELCEYALSFAKKVLKNGGNFVVKIFEGAHYNEYLMQVRSAFDFCKPYAPDATRSRSSEVYIVARGFIKV
jgi:23S rRNA (uridine2552-2'-O)-methyltransferase